MLRGSTIDQIVKAVRNQRSGIKKSTIVSLYEYWKDTVKAGKKFSNAGSHANIDKSVSSARRVNFTMVRVGVKFEFENPETDDVQIVGFDIDVDSGLSKKEVLKYISNKIFEWLFAYYQFKDLSQFKGEDFLNQIKVTYLEGI